MKDHVGNPSGDYRERKFRSTFQRIRDEIHKDFEKLSRAKNEECSRKDRLHIVAVMATPRQDVEKYNTIRTKNQRSAVACIPGEVNPQDPNIGKTPESKRQYGHMRTKSAVHLKELPTPDFTPEEWE